MWVCESDSWCERRHRQKHPVVSWACSAPSCHRSEMHTQCIAWGRSLDCAIGVIIQSCDMLRCWYTRSQAFGDRLSQRGASVYSRHEISNLRGMHTCSDIRSWRSRHDVTYSIFHSSAPNYRSATGDWSTLSKSERLGRPHWGPQGDSCKKSAQ